MEPIDCEFTTFAVCPFCGYEDHDSWEIGDGGEGETSVNCGSCDEEFLVSRHISVSYSTCKIESKPDALGETPEKVSDPK